MNSSPRTVLTLFAAAALLAACAESDPQKSDDGAAAPSKESGQTAEPRLVVASDAGAEVLDGSDLKSLGAFDLASRPKLQVAGDDRHVFVLQSDAKKVGVVDAGTWSEAHGDHSHHYTSKPRLLKTSFDSGTSYHAVSDDERSAVWFDEDASFEVFDWKGLEDDSVKSERIETGRGHHGVAAPLSDGGLLASFATGEEAEGVLVLDAEGQETARIDGCEGLHGEAHAGEDAYVFGCADGALLVDDGKGASIKAPVDGAGTSTLVGDHDSDLVVGNLFSESKPEVAQQIALYDVDAKKATAVDLGVDFNGISRDDGQSAVVGTDGQVHVIDEESGKVVEKIEAVKPWTLTNDFTDPKPQVALGGGFAWVSDPSTRTVSLFELDSGKKRTSVTLDDIPTSLALVNSPTS